MKEAKEKAEELVNKFDSYTIAYDFFGDNIQKNNNKQCALIAVDETIEALNLLLKSGLNNDFDVLGVRGYYMEVKQEIEKL